MTLTHTREDERSDAAAYERFMATWSEKIARQFLAWLAPATRGRWLDVGCGTGALTRVILELASPEHVCGIDASEQRISFVANALPGPRCRFEVADATAIPPGLGSFDAAVAGLLVSDPRPTVAAMRGAVRQGGLVAAYVWDFANGMQLLRRFWDAAAALDPAAGAIDHAVVLPWCRPEALRSLFKEARLANVEVHAIDTRARFATFAEYWVPFLAGSGIAQTYVRGLPAARRDALRARLQADLPKDSTGAIDLPLRAWAVRGWRT